MVLECPVRIGIVSDIHGHVAALRRALELMAPLDELLCLGDSISEYRFSNDTVALLRERGALVIRGNHEDVFYGPQGAPARAAAWIDADLCDWLGSQPSERLLSRCGRQILVVHSTPWQPRGEYVSEHDPQFGRYADSGADVVLYGHTHLPVVRRVGGTLIVNPGSVGESRLEDGEPGLSCAVLDPERLEATIVRFDV